MVNLPSALRAACVQPQCREPWSDLLSRAYRESTSNHQPNINCCQGSQFWNDVTSRGLLDLTLQQSAPGHRPSPEEWLFSGGVETLYPGRQQEARWPALQERWRVQLFKADFMLGGYHSRGSWWPALTDQEMVGSLSIGRMKLPWYLVTI